MYGKFFSSTFTGSMMAAGPDVFAVWGYVIAHAVDSRVELNPRLLAAVIGAPLEAIKRSIAFLCAPDEGSRSKDAEGCRLVKEGEFQYFIPTHAKYREITNEAERREYNRIKKQEERARKSDVKPNVIDSQELSAMSAHTEADTKAEAHTEAKKEKRGARGSRLPTDWSCPDDWIVWARQERQDIDPLKTAEKFADFWHGKPGSGGLKLDWYATWRNWVREERGPQKGSSSAATFRERDDALAKAKAAAWSGGLLGQDMTDTIDMETPHGRLTNR